MSDSTAMRARLRTGTMRAGQVLLGLGLVILCSWGALSVAQLVQNDVTFGTNVSKMTHVLGRPTDRSISVSVLAPEDLETYAEYGVAAGRYSGRTGVSNVKARVPAEFSIDGLKANSQYYYRLRHRRPGESAYTAGPEYSFSTQKLPGNSFVFGIQADSHPEHAARGGFDAALYSQTMTNVRRDRPDFYITLGDDFSVDYVNDRPLSQQIVSQIYIEQRPYLSQEGAGAPIFLVNGNHEQAAKYLLNGTANSPAVWAGKARNAYFPQPWVRDGRFYTGDMESVPHVGLLNDFYAWTWGDALFITLDPYWHSDVVVDNKLGEAGGGMEAGPGMGAGGTPGLPAGETNFSGMGGRDIWGITHGEQQYRWLERTLRESKAKYKFIFAHHVLGTGRGGVDMADQGEWGGKSLEGVWEFDKKRPGWELPIHQLMVKYHVSAFFQGHDHFFVHQERDGVVYQETPKPSNPSYVGTTDIAWRAAYKTGTYLPSSGHIRVTVGPQAATVDYIRSWLAKDESAERKQAEVAYSYKIMPYTGR